MRGEEKELKVILDGAGEYRRLLAFLPRPLRLERLTNHYFDTPELELQQQGMMLRIRTSDTSGSRPLLTLKWNLRVVRGTFLVDQVELPVDGATLRQYLRIPSPPDLWPREIREQLARNAIHQPLQIIGRSETRRTVIRVPSGLLLELDACRFAGGFEDYELEVEGQDMGSIRKEVRKMLAACGIPVREQRRSKFARFLHYSKVNRTE